MPARFSFPAALAYVCLALLGLTVGAGPAGAAGQAGTRVTVSKGKPRSTAALNALGVLRAPLRLQPPEREGEGDRPPRGRNPNSPLRADGRARQTGSPAVAFSGAPLAFDGPTLADAGAYPPDTQGDVGPTQFIAMINGRIRSYDKNTGAADGVLNANTDVWWSSVMTPGPGNFTTDPRIRYDRLTDRWYAVMIDVPNGGTTVNRVMLAVSDAGTITGSTVWSFFSITGVAGEFTDYPSLGLDASALYIGTNQFRLSDNGYQGTDGYVVRKSSLQSGGPVVATRFDLVPNSGASGPFAPQGVDNSDPAATVGYFIGVDNLLWSRLDVRRVSNPGGTPTLSGNLNVGVPTTAAPSKVANSGGIALDALDDRLYSAEMRGDHIWTAHNIGVDATGAASGGGRTASRWYEVNTGGAAGTPSLAQSGTIFDAAASNPREYWIPTVAVNGQGTMLIGGSTAAANTFVDAWFSGRRSQDAAGVVDTPTRYTSASAAYAAPYDRWGDYSLARVDPTDDLTLWTIQEYVNGSDSFGTRIARLRAPPPATPASASAVVPRGQASTTVTVTGTSSANSAFFDPGSGFAARIAAGVGCGATVNEVTFDSATSVTLDLNTTSATKGLCPVTVTNPDGQTASSGGGIVQTDGRPIAVDDSGAVAQGGQLDGSSVLGNDSDPDADPLTAVVATGPTHGSLSLNPDGTYTYTPAAGYSGSDSFTYRASDALLQSTPATVSLTVTSGLPAVTPGAPTGVSAVPGNGRAAVSWSAPASDGGGAVTKYTVTASPGGQTCTWSSGPLACDVTGLVNGTGYTFTVTATNVAGDGPASLPSTAITPAGAPPPDSTPPSPLTPPVLVQPPAGPPATSSRAPRAPAKLRVLRAGVSGGVLDMLVQITSRAATPGAKLDLAYRSSGLTTRFSAPIPSATTAANRGPLARAAEASIRIRRKLPIGQRRKNTGIVELTYAGSSSVRPDAVRLRAAAGKSLLKRTTTRIRSGRLVVTGTITGKARGVVRIRLGYDGVDDTTGFLYWNVRIKGGAWALDRKLPASAAGGGQLSIQFTGYEPGNLRGEQTAKQVP